MKALATVLLVIQSLGCQAGESRQTNNEDKRDGDDQSKSRILNLLNLDDGFDSTDLSFECIRPEGCDLTLSISIERGPLEDSFTFAY